jgi:hypothetical protein
MAMKAQLTKLMERSNKSSQIEERRLIKLVCEHSAEQAQLKMEITVDLGEIGGDHRY